MSYPQQNRKRDAAILKAMGLFFLIFAILLALGLFWEQENAARIVNVGATLILLAISIGCLLGSRRIAKGEGR